MREYPVWFMRGGSSKGLYFVDSAIPPPGLERDSILLSAMGSPDPFKSQIDGMGGGYSSVSKVMVVRSSTETEKIEHTCNFTFSFGQVSVDKPLIDWSGNCGNLTSALGAFVVESGLYIPTDADKSRGFASLSFWQSALKERIQIEQPLHPDGSVKEDGDCWVDGVAFPGAEIRVFFMLDVHKPTFPSGHLVDSLAVDDTSLLSAVGLPEDTTFRATLVAAGNPLAVLEAASLRLKGVETHADLSPAYLRLLERLREVAAVQMGNATSLEEARSKPAFPKICFVAPPQNYVASSGRPFATSQMDLCARIISDGRVHHAFTATGALGLTVAATTPGTIAFPLNHSSSKLLDDVKLEGNSRQSLKIGHPAGVMSAGCTLMQMERGAKWQALDGLLGRTARTLMRGFVRVLK